MMSLFTSFDLFFFPSFYMIFMYFVMKLSLNFFKSSILNLMFMTMISELGKFFLSLKAKSFNKGFLAFFSSLFLFLLMLNFSSVLSFNFASTSQISLVLLLGFTSWLSYMLFHNYFCFKGFISHCVPEGTPMYLIWFLFIIELISNSIRPLTVTVRLVANILAGHLLMILLSKLVLSLNLFMFFYLFLNLIEMVVALIQAYIFSTMLALFYSDVK